MSSEAIPVKISSSLIGIDSLLSIAMVDVIRAIEKTLTLLMARSCSSEVT